MVLGRVVSPPTSSWYPVLQPGAPAPESVRLKQRLDEIADGSGLDEQVEKGVARPNHLAPVVGVVEALPSEADLRRVVNTTNSLDDLLDLGSRHNLGAAAFSNGRPR